MSVLSRIQKTSPQTSFEEPDFAYRKQLHKRLKEDLVQTLGLGRIASMVRSNDESLARQELEVASFAILNTYDYQAITQDVKTQIVEQVLDEIIGLGAIQPLLDDSEVTEVMVNGCSSLFYEKAGSLYEAQRVFDTPEQIMLVVDRILAPLGRRLDETNPVVSARLANGDRVNAVIHPIAIDGPVVTIRKFSNQITSLDTLVELGSLPKWYATMLSWAVRARQDIAVAGGTGSGKTTLLNALSCEIPHTERIITIEDSAELQFKTHPHVVRLETRDESIEKTGEVTVRDLVKNALRMRPDRIVVGEVRGSEAIDMLQAMNTGHDGSLTTLHAGSAREAVLRLVMMARFGMDLPTDVIESQIATALDIIVLSKRLGTGKRFITSASTVNLGQEGEIVLDEFVHFNQEDKTWDLLKLPGFIKTCVVEGILDKKEVELWKASLSP